MISTELDRLEKAKTDIKTAIEAKGVSVPPDALLSTYPSRIAEIKDNPLETIGWTQEDIMPIDEAIVLAKEAYDAWNPDITDGSQKLLNKERLVIAPKIDTSKCTSLRFLFSSMNKLIFIPSIDMSSCISANNMFSRSPLIHEVNNLDTSKVQDMKQMFFRTYGLKSVTLDVSSATTMENCFHLCQSLNEIHFKGTPLPECKYTYMMQQTPQFGTIYIPTGMQEQYANLLKNKLPDWKVVEE